MNARGGEIRLQKAKEVRSTSEASQGECKGVPARAFRKHGVKDINQQEFVSALSAYLKKGGKLRVLEWADCVKLGRSRRHVPRAHGNAKENAAIGDMSIR